MTKKKTDKADSLQVETPPVLCSFSRMMAPGDLVPNPRNPNKHPETQIELLAKIIAFQGWRLPIVVSKRSGFVVRGHGRLMAAQKLGLMTVPIDEQEYESEAKEWADLIADNRIAELAEMDRATLKDIIEELDTGEIDLEFTGFTQGDLEDLMSEFFVPEEGLTDEDEIPEEVEARTKLGDLWQLGDHRISCGNATKAEAWDALAIKGEVIAFASPPYNAGKSAPLNTNAAKKGSHYRNDEDNRAPDEYLHLLQCFLDRSLEYCVASIVNIAPLAGNKREIIRFVAANLIHFVDVATWDKENAPPQMAPAVMSSRFEWLLIFSPKKNASRTIPLASWKGTVSSVHAAPKQLENVTPETHSATFPIHLPTFILGTLCDKAPGVVDYCLGSGTTLIAAQRLERICYGIEIDPHYCDVAIQRWEDFTGKKAKKVKA